jgi:IclR family acetate operon transcriptional repressor
MRDTLTGDEETGMGDRVRGGATSAERTMDVLEFLARRTYPTPTMVIAAECGIPKSSLHNLLNLMRDRRFVTYHAEQRAWSLGPRLCEIGGDAPLLAHTLAVFRAFGQGTGPIDAPEIARQSDLPPAAVARILPELEDAGLVSRTSGGRYRPGLQLVALASRVGELDRLRLAARPVLRRLRDATGETSNLVVLDADHALYIDQVESRHALRHAGWVGRQIPLDSTAAGAALAGGEGPHVARDSVEKGVTAIAAHIPGTVDPPAAVSVTGPNFRLEGTDEVRAESAVTAAAIAIATALDPRALDRTRA